MNRAASPMHPRARVAAIVLVAFLLFLAGCQTPTAPRARIWASADLFAAAELPEVAAATEVGVPPPATVSLHAAINETVSFRVSIAGPGRIDVHVGGFVSEHNQLIAGSVTLYCMHSVHIDHWPGWHVRDIPPARRQSVVEDVLVPVSAPRGGLPAAATPDQPVDLWVDVQAPLGTAPGQYRATMDVLSDSTLAGQVDISLQIHPFVRPDRVEPLFLCDLDHRALFWHHVRFDGQPYSPARILEADPARDKLEGVLDDTARLLHAHGLCVQIPGLRPLFHIDADGRVAVDWADYDRVVGPLLDGRAFPDRLPLRLWRLPLDSDFPRPPDYGPLHSPTFARLLGQYVGDAGRHFSEQGWLDRAYAALPASGPFDAVAYRTAAYLGYIIHRAAPHLRLLSTLLPDSSVAGLAPAVASNLVVDFADIWAPPARVFDPQAVAADFLSAGWLLLDQPPFSGTTDVRAPHADLRVLAWQAYITGAKAVDIGCVNPWPEVAGHIATPQECIDHDPTALIYPGAVYGLGGPVPSVRLKLLRRSVQDAAYLALLDSRGKQHIAATLAASLVRYAGINACGAHLADPRRRAWVRDERWWSAARAIMADEASATVTERLADAADRSAAGADEAASVAVTDPSSLPSTLRWRRFMEATRQVYFDVEGVRLHPLETGNATGFEAVCSVAIVNHRRVPITGRLRFGVLPPGWVAVDDASPASTVGPGETLRLRLTAQVSALTWNEGGLLELPLQFVQDDGTVLRFSARFCHITPQMLDMPIDIDGDLSEWPPAVGNYASDFRLISGPGDATATVAAGPDHPDAARATHPVLCLVGQRDDALYFAFRCDLAPGVEPDAVRGNIVAREDLVPIDRELVEILLDPTNAGARSPNELYHVVVTPTGAAWHKGVDLAPPVGGATFWPAGIRHATQVHRGPATTPDQAATGATGAASVAGETATAGGYWTAEIEIPLSAFPESARESKVWGLNLTRYDRAAQEYSNWSAAVGNVYDPLTLGNMSLNQP